MKATEDEIYTAIDTASENIEDGNSMFPSMSYEEGVKAALEWVINGGPHPFD
jgi:hypothetical protein